MSSLWTKASLSQDSRSATERMLARSTPSVWNDRFAEELLAAPDYRGFLKLCCRNSRRSVSYSAFARRAGYSSRSYVRDVIEGKRRLTPLAIPKFARAAELTGEWKEYFRLLVAMTEKDARPEGWSRERVASRLGALRDRIRSRRFRRSVTGDKKLTDRLLTIPHFVEIYTALGIVGERTSVAKVAQRTGLTREALSGSLEKIEQESLVTWDRDADTLTPHDFHLSLTHASQSQRFKSLYQQSLRNAAKESSQDLASLEKLFHQSVFLARKSDLAKMKSELREVLLKYVDSRMDTQGDHVVTLVAAFF